MTLAVWSNEYDVRFGNYQIGSTDRPALAALPNGGYVIGWREGNKISLQVLDGAGNPVGPVTPIDAVGAGGITQNYLDVEAIGDSGQFVVTWNATDGTGNFDLNTRIFNADLTTGAVSQLADNFNTSAIYIARVAAGAEGRFISTYMEGENIRLKVHNADGTDAGTVVVDSGSNIDNPEIAYIGQNRFVVSYGQGDNINFRIIDASNPANPIAVTGELPAGAGAIVGAVAEVIALKDANGAPSGQFAVVRQAGTTIIATFYNQDGTPLNNSGNPVLITDSVYTGKDFMSVTALRGGRIAVTYSGQGPNDNDYILLKIAKSDGSGEAPQTLTISKEGNQEEPRIAEMADGRLSIGWNDPTEPKSAISTIIVDPRIAAVTVNGTAGRDVYAGSEYNGNVLNGAAGNDKLIGGKGTDQMNGGADTDTVSYEKSNAAVTVNLATKSGAGGHAAGDVYDSIENAMGSAHGDALYGDGGANYLWGLGGNDVLVGAAGADTMDGGAGNDRYYIDNALDRVVETAGNGTDTVVASVSFSLMSYVHVENITAESGTAAISLTGSNAANAITGNSGSNTLKGEGGNDVIIGGAGADAMYGGTGNDVFYVDNARDRVYESAKGGTDTVYTTVSFAMTSTAEIERLTATGKANVALTGNKYANTITGNAGANKISGGLGNDALKGGSGKDAFVFDAKLNKSTNVDKVLDFKSKDDSFFLDNKVFTKLGAGTSKGVKLAAKMFVEGTKAKDKNDRIIYDKKTGSLYYDADGTGSSAQVKIATLSNKEKLFYHDFFVI